MEEHRTGDEANDAPEQTWGQGVGKHEPTIPEDPDEPKTYAEGERTDLDDPDLPLSRENEGMNR